MQFESTASQSSQLQEWSSSTAYLINTSKALKGHKIKTKDFVRLQLLKLKHISLERYNQTVTKQDVLLAKNNNYTKFKPFETIQEEETYLKIANQRQKMSRETKGKIKLFNNTRISSLFSEPNERNSSNTLEVRTRPVVSHESREPDRKQIKCKSVTEQFRNTTASLQQKTKNSNLMFSSQNIGKKMNKLLNALINRKQPKQKQKQQKEQSQVTQIESSTFCVSNPLYRKKNNITFMRQMKKHRKLKIQEKNSQSLSRLNNVQAAHQESFEISHREKRVKLQNRANKTFNSYSVELRKRGTTIDFRNCLLKRQHQYGDSFFI